MVYIAKSEEFTCRGFRGSAFQLLQRIGGETRVVGWRAGVWICGVEFADESKDLERAKRLVRHKIDSVCKALSECRSTERERIKWNHSED